MPEWVPLENKGEEAIIRGMGDVLFPEGNVEFHILDMLAKEYRFVEGLHVYPGTWFYSTWRSQEFGLGLSPRKLYASTCSLVRNGMNVAWPGWVKCRQWPLKKTARLLRRAGTSTGARNEKAEALRRIRACDYLIAGHDGALNEYDCHIIDVMREFGMRFGIFGSSMKPGVKSQAIIDVFHNSLAHADFVYCRNPIAVEWATRHFPEIQIALAPDPAFGMLPSPKERTQELVASEGLSQFFEKPVVMVTSAEPAPIARHCFSEVPSPAAKLTAHRDLLALLVRHVVTCHDANVLFLPHAIGPGPELDDRRAAHDVLRRAQLPAERARILETDLSARDLKGLIREASMLIAERIHSIIGAVGVHTPFCCLGSRTDVRVRGIVGDMLRAKHTIYYLNSPSERELLAHFDSTWAHRDEIREYMQSVNTGLRSSLERAGKAMRQKMGI